ncbi:MAG TPA: hypothetical protein VM030_09285 [Acidimicrobiales bacterium]|nr:hypothetical protein [Acidimicrobiales bacterium]
MERRARIAGWVTAAKRVGYGLLLVAVTAFFVGAATSFSGTIVTLVTIAMAASAVLLAPAIVFGYAVGAAEREDRERGL